MSKIFLQKYEFKKVIHRKIKTPCPIKILHIPL
jgi:hypothetical protein